MRSQKPSLHLVLVWRSLFLMALCAATGARAEGGYSEPSYAHASGLTADYAPGKGGTAVSADSVTINATLNGVTIDSTTGGGAAAHDISSVAGTWGTTVVQTTVPSSVTVDSKSFSTTFTKGTSSITKARSETTATITIDGRTYAVAKELAMAAARATQFGSSSSVEVDGTLSVAGNSYSTPVASSKGTR